MQGMAAKNIELDHGRRKDKQCGPASDDVSVLRSRHLGSKLDCAKIKERLGNLLGQSNIFDCLYWFNIIMELNPLQPHIEF